MVDLENATLMGGYIQGEKQALISSFNGITYFIDYKKDTFTHEGIIKKVSTRNIKLIGDHFYLTSGACKILQREKEDDWIIYSKPANEYWKENQAGGAAQAVDGFDENNIYFSTDEGLVWHYNGSNWKIIDTPSNGDFTQLICAEDGNVYIGGYGGQLMVGSGDHFKNIVTSKGAIKAGIDKMFAMVFFKGVLYGAMDHSLMKLDNGKWVTADINVYSIGYLAVKDGIMLIGTKYSLYIFDGNETQTLYDNEAYNDAIFLA